MCASAIRNVVQYHYTIWPDMGVPEHTGEVVDFIQTVTGGRMQHKEGPRPVVVHCSAGVGRTGTYITLDSMLEQQAAEQRVDVHNFIARMRQNRIHMVQVLDQYKFIFAALLENYMCGDTRIPRNVFGKVYPSLLKRGEGEEPSAIAKEFQLLEAYTIHPRSADVAAAKSRINVDKNRFPDKVPTDRTRPFLMTKVEDGSDYINASFLPGYKKRFRFVATQTPLPNTVADFWRLVTDYKVSWIIMLHEDCNNASYAQYWPYADSEQYGPYTVTLMKEETNKQITRREFQIIKHDSAYPSRTVYQLQLNAMPVEGLVVPAVEDVLALDDRLMSAKMEGLRDEDSPLLIHCSDGVSMTGCFCAVLAVLDELAADWVVDVFHASKKIRLTRPGTIPTLDQYVFIYNAVASYLRCNLIYENYTEKR